MMVHSTANAADLAIYALTADRGRRAPGALLGMSRIVDYMTTLSSARASMKNSLTCMYDALSYVSTRLTRSRIQRMTINGAAERPSLCK
jgi:hypothetical protein